MFRLQMFVDLCDPSFVSVYSVYRFSIDQTVSVQACESSYCMSMMTLPLAYCYRERDETSVRSERAPSRYRKG